MKKLITWKVGGATCHTLLPLGCFDPLPKIFWHLSSTPNHGYKSTPLLMAYRTFSEMTLFKENVETCEPGKVPFVLFLCHQYLKNTPFKENVYDAKPTNLKRYSFFGFGAISACKTQIFKENVDDAVHLSTPYLDAGA